MQDSLIETGRWTWGDESVEWELFSASVLPDEEKCSAAFCVAIASDAVVMVREDRGWGMAGGHLELDETIEQALLRECNEEAGFTPVNPRLFAYRRIIANTPVKHPNPMQTYPFPVSYIAYYWTILDDNLPLRPSDKSILEIKKFSIDQLHATKAPDLSTIQLGWQAFLATNANET